MAGFAADALAEIAHGWAPPVVGGGARSVLQADEFLCLSSGSNTVGLGYGYGYGISTSGGYGFGYGNNCNQTVLPSSPIMNNSTGTPAAVAYVMGAWSKCSKPCGTGQQIALVTCQNLDPSATTTNLLPLTECAAVSLQQDLLKLRTNSTLSAAIILQQPCNTQVQPGLSRLASPDSASRLCITDPVLLSLQVCPAFMYKISTWTPCSTTCGGGNQTRTVTCIVPSTGSVAPDASCAGLSDDTRTSQ